MRKKILSTPEHAEPFLGVVGWRIRRSGGALSGVVVDLIKII
jgi:hypothetical protein